MSEHFEKLDAHQDDREKWLEARRSMIGASESAVILGRGKWGSRLSIFADKLGLMPAEENESMYWGKKLEDVIADELGRELMLPVKPSGFLLRSKRWPFLGTTLDAVVDSTWPAELKASTMDGEWSDGVPDHYWIQVQHQLAVTGREYGYIAALLAGRGFKFRWQRVERDERFIMDTLVPECAAFWESVKSGIQPEADASPASKAALDALFPKDNGETIALPGEALELDTEYLMLEERLSGLSEQREGIRNRFRQMIGDAQAGALPNGTRWTNKANKNGVRSLKRIG